MCCALKPHGSFRRWEICTGIAKTGSFSERLLSASLQRTILFNSYPLCKPGLIQKIPRYKLFSTQLCIHLESCFIWMIRPCGILNPRLFAPAPTELFVQKRAAELKAIASLCSDINVKHFLLENYNKRMESVSRQGAFHFHCCLNLFS